MCGQLTGCDDSKDATLVADTALLLLALLPPGKRRRRPEGAGPAVCWELAADPCIASSSWGEKKDSCRATSCFVGGDSASLRGTRVGTQPHGPREMSAAALTFQSWLSQHLRQ